MRRTVFLAGVLPFVSAFLGAVLAYGLVVPSLAMAQPTAQQEVRARSFVLVDDDGAVRARLAIIPSGHAVLQFIGASGTTANQLGLTGLTVYGPGGGPHDIVMRVGRCAIEGTCAGGLPPFEGLQLGPDGSIGVIPAP